ncbi:MAG: hypothetical protein CM15mV37_0960 [uncultured marine virus]|nr:MAG: hypothetical protein CM15mV37_0960 [uncultured marine virus]
MAQGQTKLIGAVGISSLFSSTENFFKITGVQLGVGVETDFGEMGLFLKGKRDEDIIKIWVFKKNLWGFSDGNTTSKIIFEFYV